MVSRLRLLCLGLGILSTVMGCAATPPPMAPLRATLAPAAPSAVAPPAPLLLQTPRLQWPPCPMHLLPLLTGTGRPDVYQSSPYERKMDEEERDYRQTAQCPGAGTGAALSAMAAGASTRAGSAL